MRIRSRILITIVAALVALLGLGAPARADVDVTLGGVDLNTYCQSLGYAGVYLPNEGSASGYACVGAPGGVGLSVVDACNYQFNDLVVAGYPVTAVNRGGAGGWKCHSSAVQTHSYGGLDLSGFCRSLGYAGSVHRYDNVAGWRCVSSTGAEVVLPLHAACRWQYSSAVSQGWTIVSRWNTYADWTGITCLGLRKY